VEKFDPIISDLYDSKATQLAQTDQL